MSAASDGEFLRLLKKDIDYFERAVVRFEDLIPRVCAPLQDQWRLQAQCRRHFTMELEILMEKAEECLKSSVAVSHNDSALLQVAAHSLPVE
jgi:hypothetical protein